MPNLNPNLINSNSPTVSPFLRDCTVHIPYSNVKMFTDDVLSNRIGDEELKSIDGTGNRVLTKKEIKKDDIGWFNSKFNDLCMLHVALFNLVMA
nr:hypothetical protein [Tanacetum cinerariifolium]